MPTYVYEVLLEDDEPGQVFEVVQKMTDPPLTHHPQTGQPVRRVIQPPYISAQHTEKRQKNLTSDDSLKSKGFTKYVKTADGKYEKAFGKGPGGIERKIVD
jgi:hypothetical protein